MKTSTSPSQEDYSRICDELRAMVEGNPGGEYKGFCIADQDGQKQAGSFGLTEDDAWTMFCWPALNREAYEGEGYRAVPTLSRQKRTITVKPSDAVIDYENSL